MSISNPPDASTVSCLRDLPGPVRVADYARGLCPCHTARAGPHGRADRRWSRRPGRCEGGRPPSTAQTGICDCTRRPSPRPPPEDRGATPVPSSLLRGGGGLPRRACSTPRTVSFPREGILFPAGGAQSPVHYSTPSAVEQCASVNSALVGPGPLARPPQASHLGLGVSMRGER